jgi:hypothetical protein
VGAKVGNFLLNGGFPYSEEEVAGQVCNDGVVRISIFLLCKAKKKRIFVALYRKIFFPKHKTT